MGLAGLFHHILARYKPLNGSSYIVLPSELQHATKGMINIKNMDDECFRWCHLAHKFPISKDQQRITKYRDHIDESYYDGIKFPVVQNQYDKIEKQNAINVNVFGYEYKQPSPIYLSRESNDDVY